MDTASATGALAEAFAHCADAVRTGDPDRATAIQFAPAGKRPFLHALYAFDAETAQIRDRIRQAMAGEIRLQWWRDTIEAGAAAASVGEGGAPVAAALAETIRRCDLPVAAFDRLLEARVFDLYDDPMPSREAFEAYAGETASTVIVLAAMILDRDRAPSVAGLAGHAGVAELCRDVLLRERLHSSRGQVYVPADLLDATGLDGKRWLEGGESAEPARRAMRALGQDHLGKVEGGWRSVPRGLRPAFLASRLRAASLAGGRGTASPLARLWAYWRAMRAPESLG